MSDASPRTGRRRGTVVAIVVAGVAVVGLAIGLVVAFTGGAGGPEQAVRDYLRALADGDASAALRLGPTPPDTAFVSDAALAAQRAVAAVSDVEVDDATTRGDRAQVHAGYRFGPRRVDATYDLRRSGDRWQLTATVYPVDLAGVHDVAGLTLQGVDATTVAQAYVFPGPLVWGTSDPLFTVTEAAADGFPTSPTAGAAAASDLTTDLSAAGTAALGDAVGTYLDGCAASTSLEPSGCPQTVLDVGAVADSATWTAPTDLSTLRHQVNADRTVTVSGDLTWPVAYAVQDGSGAASTKTATVQGPVFGTANLSASPPTFSPR